MPVVLYGAMHAAEGASLEAPSWFEPADRVSARLRSRRALRARRDDDGPTSLRAIVASSSFLVLFAVALMVGGHAAIDPLLRSAIAAREAKGIGDVVYPTRDGRYCRHMSFDNATAEIVEGKVEPCPEDVARGVFRNTRGFAWGEQ